MSVQLTQAQEEQSRIEAQELREMGLHPLQQIMVDNAYQDATAGSDIIWNFETGKCMVLTASASTAYRSEHRWAYVVASKH